MDDNELKKIINGIPDCANINVFHPDYFSESTTGEINICEGSDIKRLLTNPSPWKEIVTVEDLPKVKGRYLATNKWNKGVEEIYRDPDHQPNTDAWVAGYIAWREPVAPFRQQAEGQERAFGNMAETLNRQLGHSGEAE